MKIVLCGTPEGVGRYAADLIQERMARGPMTLGLATGSSPRSTYQELERRHREEGLSFVGVTAFTLDEYVGLARDHEQSYHSTIRRELTDRVDLPLHQLHTPRGDAADPHEEAARYDREIREAGGVDLQLLGIGANGHIGFNEPTSSLSSRTRVKVLTPTTRRDNSRFFRDEEVPRTCITQGLGTIGEAKTAVLVAQGRSKAAAVRAMVEGPVSAMCPASVLQFHRRALILLDDDAAAELSMLDYFREEQRLATR
jgi:glucosamine-6-phosphate deaminase